MDKTAAARRDRDRASPARQSAARGAGKRVTMTDVARTAACSQSTVSVVLNNTPGIRISKTTRERVIKVAEQLGYEIIPGHAALSDRPRQIAIVFDRIATSPEAVVSIDGAREMAWTTGHVVTIAQTLNDAEMEPATIEAVLRNGVDAMIYATIMTRKVEVPAQLYKARRAGGAPQLLLRRPRTSRASVPARSPAAIAPPRRWSRAGHRRIAIITGEMWMDAARDRLRGYRQALATADIAYDPALVREGNWQTSAGYDQTHALMKLRQPADGDLLLQRPHGGRLLRGAQGARILDSRRRLGDRLRRRGGRPPPLAAAHDAGAAAPRDGALGDRAGAVAGRHTASSRSPSSSAR